MNIEQKDMTKIAQLFFRIDVEKITHTKHAFQFIDWLGEIGGIQEILEKTFSFILGGYLLLNWKLQTMICLYLDEDKKN